MTGRRAVFGLCMLCALALSALAAQSAGAVTKGTTGFTCVKDEASGTLSGAHCLNSGGTGKYSHVAFAANTTTEVAGTNANTATETTAATPLTLKVTVAGTPIELRASGLQGTGSTENRTNASGEHFIADTGTTTFTGVTVQKPAGKGCKVYEDKAGVEGVEGVINTSLLKVTTEGQGDFFKFEPSSGTQFATFFLTCNKGEVPEACEGTFTLTGSMKAPASGATVVFSHEEITTQNTLKMSGTKAALDGKVTISGRDATKGDIAFTPLSVTTVETP